MCRTILTLSHFDEQPSLKAVLNLRVFLTNLFSRTGQKPTIPSTFAYGYKGKSWLCGCAHRWLSRLTRLRLVGSQHTLNVLAKILLVKKHVSGSSEARRPKGAKPTHVLVQNEKPQVFILPLKPVHNVYSVFKRCIKPSVSRLLIKSLKLLGSLATLRFARSEYRPNNLFTPFVY